MGKLISAVGRSQMIPEDLLGNSRKSEGKGRGSGDFQERKI